MRRTFCITLISLSLCSRNGETSPEFDYDYVVIERQLDSSSNIVGSRDIGRVRDCRVNVRKISGSDVYRAPTSQPSDLPGPSSRRSTSPSARRGATTVKPAFNVVQAAIERAKLEAEAEDPSTTDVPDSSDHVEGAHDRPGPSGTSNTTPRSQEEGSSLVASVVDMSLSSMLSHAVFEQSEPRAPVTHPPEAAVRREKRPNPELAPGRPTSSEYNLRPRKTGGVPAPAEPDMEDASFLERCRQSDLFESALFRRTCKAVAAEYGKTHRNHPAVNRGRIRWHLTMIFAFERYLMEHMKTPLSENVASDLDYMAHLLPFHSSTAPQAFGSRHNLLKRLLASICSPRWHAEQLTSFRESLDTIFTLPSYHDSVETLNAAYAYFSSEDASTQTLLETLKHAINILGSVNARVRIFTRVREAYETRPDCTERLLHFISAYTALFNTNTLLYLSRMFKLPFIIAGSEHTPYAGAATEFEEKMKGMQACIYRKFSRDIIPVLRSGTQPEDNGNLFWFLKTSYERVKSPNAVLLLNDEMAALEELRTSWTRGVIAPGVYDARFVLGITASINITAFMAFFHSLHSVLSLLLVGSADPTTASGLNSALRLMAISQFNPKKTELFISGYQKHFAQRGQPERVPE